MLVSSVLASSTVAMPRSLDHHPWAGINLVDLVFPVFVTLTGAGIAFAYVRGIRKPKRLARRVIVLFLVGILYGAVTEANWDLGTLRLFGVLQLYAGVILVVSTLHVWFRTWRAWAAIVIVAAVMLTALGTIFAVHCGGTIIPACNPSRSIDLSSLWVTHTYHAGALGHDPEGFVAMAGATLQAAVGAMFGHIMLAARSSKYRLQVVTRVGGIAVIGLLAIAAASTVTPLLFGAESLPIMKRLWTPPFALVIGACTGVVLLGAFLWIDRGGALAVQTRVRRFELLVALGRNSLLVYFGSHVVNSVLRQNGVIQPMVGTVGEFWFPFGSVVAWMLLAFVLNRRGWYVRA